MRDYASLALGVTIIALVLVAGLAGISIVGYSPEAQDYEAVLQGPSGAHWLGTDNLGRDLASRVFSGIRVSLVVAVMATGIAIIGGIPLGLIAGTSGNLRDNVIMRPLDALMAFPAIIIALVLATILGAGLAAVVVSIGLVTIPIIAKVLRASVLSVRHELYVEAARARGASMRQVLVRAVLMNSLGPTIIQVTVLMGVAVLLEATLSFLGVGVQPPRSSLGIMLADGRNYMAQSVWVVVVPGIAIMITVLGFNLAGDGLRDYLDPRKRRR